MGSFLAGLICLDIHNLDIKIMYIKTDEAREKGTHHDDPLLNFRIDAGVGVLRTHRTQVAVQEFR